LNLTLTVVGRRAGMTRQGVANIEHLRRVPGLDTALRLSRALETPLAHLVDRIDRN